MAENPPSNPRLTQEEMRRRFNEGKYYERMKTGEFKAVRVRTGTPEPDVLKKYGQNTISVSVWDRDQDGKDIVRVHQYESPNGDILYVKDGIVHTDGRPDPKELFEDGVLYHQEKKKKPKK
jgi:hypothetical protein